ncbi:MAG: four helix bundle protein [Hyphomicrobiales bacterium]|nr:four helix bundle protein [Rickettsiales bacterium]MCP5361271.1 four helix bundle protein [Hyphomicrobiales bacterium]
MGTISEFKPFIRSAKELDVYKSAYAISLEIHTASLSFPKEEQYALAGQMRRASKSICANIAEGFAKQKYSPAEFRRFLQMAIGSSEEMQVWIDYCVDLNYISTETHTSWQEVYDLITRKLYTLHSKTKDN